MKKCIYIIYVIGDSWDVICCNGKNTIKPNTKHLHSMIPNVWFHALNNHDFLVVFSIRGWDFSTNHGSFDMFYIMFF